MCDRASPLLDVGLVAYESENDPYVRSRGRSDFLPSATPLETRSFADMRRHAAYRFLLQLDGHSCSYRLQSLLATGSLVLKQDSYYHEYYYSALQPGVHYIPFWNSSPLDILPAHAAGVPQLETMRKAHARHCYWRALLRAYAKRLRYVPQPHERWPAAVPLPPLPRRERAIDWSRVSHEWRRRDDASLERFDEELERELAALLADGRRLESEAERRSPQAPPIKHHPGVKWFS
ncbi:hypothetical protein EMIHUDRAFT_250719 [Emiliania huxleyi CCMP1516]|uniref:Glycosyl transferase CAP10 domain-containing protein n=2 Tax=Emiliania huxleyi TaxID=2903 RepID=A0A0D3HYC8_EMIH1|nr:hypothetical protein EMIHUDRAFT_250719 [Emiliania huxleyi CCMP1516]EOD04013.1 hypothetical protein EMIHUDRAFT_250719 [Emiliania huxleyi CCMP1516]|eukprot:XP_005756442.1 hypothetical protein EMIHUDRAFT_250719 [Emiliania huxleyi CCMP1516]